MPNSSAVNFKKGMQPFQDSFQNSFVKDENLQKVPIKPVPISKFVTLEPQKAEEIKNTPIIQQRTSKKGQRDDSKQKVFKTQESTNPCTVEVEVIPETPESSPP